MQSFGTCLIEDSVGKYDPNQELDLMKASAWRTQGTSTDDRTSFLYISLLEVISLTISLSTFIFRLTIISVLLRRKDSAAIATSII